MMDEAAHLRLVEGLESARTLKREHGEMLALIEQLAEWEKAKGGARSVNAIAADAAAFLARRKVAT